MHSAHNQTHTAKPLSRTPLKDPGSTPPARREGEREWREEGEEQRPSAAEGRRENARSRGFEMRVSNISNINEKIYGLLSLIKRDKTDEPLPRSQPERIPLQSKQDHSTNVLPRQETGNNERPQSYAIRLQNLQKLQAIPHAKKVQPNHSFTREIKIDSNPEYIYKKSYEYTPKNQAKTPSKYDKNCLQNIPPKAQKPVSKRSYLPAEYEEKPAVTPKGKPTKNKFLEEQIEYQKYEIKIERRNDDYTPTRPRKAQAELEQALRQREEKPVPESVRLEAKPESKFENITLQSEKKQETSKKPASFALPASIPKPQSSSFRPIAPADESSRAQKLNTTTKLIDEQIKRIKCKIEESESHSQWMHSKLEKQRGERHSSSQTYIEEEDDPED